MSSIAETIRQLRGGQDPRRPAAPRLAPLLSFGSNPGALNGWFHAPSATGSASNPALVVVLHGCTQTAAAYDHGAGWSDLGERFGFAVLFPEQQRSNNPNLCFNWFVKDDTSRDGGEALSIRQMIDAMVARHAIDSRRIFVTGLSAGGAMANVMLATYPELFAGGSIIAGLPFGSATSVSEALTLMRGDGRASPEARAFAYAGRRPRVSVWYGDADRTVAVANADRIVDQWRALHGVASAPDRVDLVDGQRHRAWLDQDGAIVVEDYRIAGLGHGTPLKTTGPGGCGNAGAYMLEAGISSTWHQARRWGLMDGASMDELAPARTPGPAVPPDLPSMRPRTRAADVTATIENALRAARLMR